MKFQIQSATEEMKMTAALMFEQTYKKPAQYTAFTPYRICPIGAHSDHQLGKITGIAIDKGIHIAYGPKENGIVEIKSLQFDKRAQWHVAATQKPCRVTGQIISAAQQLLIISVILCAEVFAQLLTVNYLSADFHHRRL